MAKPKIRCLKCGPKRRVPIFPPLVSRIPPSVLTWNDGVVVKLAKAARRRRRKADMLILADALEEAGYDNQFVLTKLRTDPPFARPLVLFLIFDAPTLPDYYIYESFWNTQPWPVIDGP